MLYFTFLGTSPYSEVPTFFSDKRELPSNVRYVQTMIFRRHLDDIDKMFVFVTDEARARNWNGLLEELSLSMDPEHPVEIIPVSIPEHMTFEDFVSLLSERLERENRELIFDITHSFRSLPILSMFAMKYAEQEKNAEMKHLYYGQVYSHPETMEDGRKRTAIDQVEIIDFARDYRLQKASDLLRQFEDTLTVSSDEWKTIIEEDSILEPFFASLDLFSVMIEQSRFDSALEALDQILLNAGRIQEKGMDYRILLPLTSKIQAMLEDIPGKSELEQKIALIRLLLDHRRTQAAITFTDQLFREELIRNSSMDYEDNENPEIYVRKINRRRREKDQEIDRYNTLHGTSLSHEKKWRRNPRNFGYEYSQYLLGPVYRIRNAREYNPFFQSLLDQNQAGRIGLLLQDEKTRKTINRFFGLRNSMNHGSSVQQPEEIRKIVEAMLHYAKKLQQENS